jgi:hypothetical protein
MLIRTACVAVLLTMPALATQAQSLTADETEFTSSLAASTGSNGLVTDARAENAEPAGGASLHYVVQPSGLDRIDPANMRMFGGEIGGNGVKGGAVVSLTWPTDR